MMTAFGKTFHPACFTCTACNMELSHKNFFERDEKYDPPYFFHILLIIKEPTFLDFRAYCELCYHTQFSPRCAACDGPILDKCVSALDRTWHPECFVCEECARPFGEDGYHEKVK